VQWCANVVDVGGLKMEGAKVEEISCGRWPEDMFSYQLESFAVPARTHHLANAAFVVCTSSYCVARCEWQ